MASVSAAATFHNDPATHTASPRKRRRKTVSGATDDCFACRRRNAVCDRKRPYCTQCIEIGKECSGYKTTLTWGVGVASRGKLRGKSTPVAANSVDAGGSASPSAEARPRNSSATKVKEEKLEVGATNCNIDPQFSTVTSSSYPPAYQPLLPTISAGQEGWHVPDFPDHLVSPQHNRVRPSVLRHHSLQHIHTALGPQYDAHGIPRSGSSMGSFPETEFHSPLEYPQTPGSTAFSETFPLQHTSVPFTNNQVSSSLDPYMDTLSSSLDSLHSISSFPDVHTLEGTPPEQNNFVPLSFDHDEMLFSPGFDMALTYDPFDNLEQQAQENDTDVDPKALALFDTRFSGPFFHMTPRLQSLLEYYGRHVCTYLVAFDGPENPYRNILQLASQNEGLQNAIAALATNNLRMRRKESSSRQSSFVQDITEAFDGGSRSNEFDHPTPEETCYKQMSIDHLNMQLTDPRAAHDDSVLATLLILCLFHVCDSGFSKFKTQLAGVQKLLSLRSPQGQSDFTGWVEMFFIWFDVMTSAVNDREIVIKGESLDLMDYSANLGALEQFSGCDGRLFKLIARLGRLNLLAQGKPVRPQRNGLHRPGMARKSSFDPMRRRVIPRSLSASDYANVDGNGWGNPIMSSDEEDGGVPQNKDFDRRASDDRHEFWTEWNDVRQRLQSWQMESASPPPSGTPAPEFEMGQRDLLHINESFRCSALLYTERLGHPVLPSSHPNFQKYVSRALFHITSLEITSCVNKFLLWPLFIIGTECVVEAHRNIIRTRCIEVAKESGFYNNISGLEVLEKVWREVGHNVQGMEAAEIKARRRDSEAGRTGRYGQAFRWRKAMDRVDGEYILI